MMAGICNGVLNSYRKFTAAALGPSIYNLGCTLSIYLFADTDPESMAKAAGFVTLSAFVYFLIQLIFSFRKFRYYRPVLDLAGEGFRKLFGQAVPSLLNSTTAQLNTVISTAFVSMSAVEEALPHSGMQIRSGRCPTGSLQSASVSRYFRRFPVNLRQVNTRSIKRC